MRLLLDTHVWLWLQIAPARIRAELLADLRDPRNSLFLSAASSWEIAIKHSIGKLPLPEAPHTYIPSRMQREGVSGLAVEHRHALGVAALPHHHADPFDRLLISQARAESIAIVTADPQFAAYDVELIAAA